MRTPPTPRPTSDRDGVALMLTLWLLLVLGGASLTVLGEVRNRVDVAALVRARTIARYGAESGIVEARSLLEDIVGNAGTPEQQAQVFAEFQALIEARGERNLGSARYRVVVEDLNARVDLNRSSDVVIEGLLRQVVRGASAEKLTSSLRAVTGGGDAPFEAPPALQVEDSTPRSGQRPGRPLMHIEELARVPGFGASLAAELAPFVTVWGDGLINVNTAPVTVLAAIPGVGAAAARSLADAREGGRIYPSRLAVYSELSEQSADVSSSLPDVTTTSRRILVVSRGWEEGQAYSHEVQAVFDVLASRLVSGTRVRLRYWVEKER